MIVVGKCPPEPDALDTAADRGFKTVELYLEKDHLESVEETVAIVEASDVAVASVHTPHVSLADKEYLFRTDRLAADLDAFVVFHSRYLNHVDTPQLEELNQTAAYGYENKTGVSVRHLEHMILKQGHDLVLDIAHLYMAEEDYLTSIEYLLTKYPDQIGLVHLCDSTPVQDGLKFGAGNIDLDVTSQLLGRYFDGTVVLEVMPADQQSALGIFAENHSRFDLTKT